MITRLDRNLAASARRRHCSPSPLPVVVFENARLISVSLRTFSLANMTSSSHPSATRALQMELKSLQQSPMEGFTVNADDQNLFKWTVAIFGPPGTLYQGGYFKASIKFRTLIFLNHRFCTYSCHHFPASSYPYSPPTLRFLSRVWHPNVYEVCFVGFGI